MQPPAPRTAAEAAATPPRPRTKRTQKKVQSRYMQMFAKASPSARHVENDLAEDDRAKVDEYNEEIQRLRSQLARKRSLNSRLRRKLNETDFEQAHAVSNEHADLGRRVTEAERQLDGLRAQLALKTQREAELADPDYDQVEDNLVRCEKECRELFAANKRLDDEAHQLHMKRARFSSIIGKARQYARATLERADAATPRTEARRLKQVESAEEVVETVSMLRLQEERLAQRLTKLQRKNADLAADLAAQKREYRDARDAQERQHARRLRLAKREAALARKYDRLRSDFLASTIYLRDRTEDYDRHVKEFKRLYGDDAELIVVEEGDFADAPSDESAGFDAPAPSSGAPSDAPDAFDESDMSDMFDASAPLSASDASDVSDASGPAEAVPADGGDAEGSAGAHAKSAPTLTPALSGEIARDIVDNVEGRMGELSLGDASSSDDELVSSGDESFGDLEGDDSLFASSSRDLSGADGE